MNSAEKPEFLKRLLGLAEIFTMKLSEQAIELYWLTLRDLALEDFSKAANVLARQARFFPKPVEFREAILPPVAFLAAEAYRKVEEAFRKAGVYRSVEFDDPTIHAVIEHLGGWQEYCNTPDDKLVFWRRDFEKYYAIFNERVKSGQYSVPPALPGLYASDDHATKMAQERVFIGDANKKPALTQTVQPRRIDAGEDISIRDTLDVLGRR